jgi:hypothetical protein
MYWLGSVGCVGSWFFISATNRVRKSFAVMVELLASAAAAVVELLLVPVVPAGDDDALGLANALATLVAELAICGAPVTIC